MRIKKLSIFKDFFKFMFLILFFCSINNLIVFGFEDKLKPIKENKNDYDFEKILFQNSIAYENYDSIANQFRVFFGYSSHSPEKKLFSDFSIINTSVSIRELYKLKLNDMTKIK